jgi:hypothetical protein
MSHFSVILLVGSLILLLLFSGCANTPQIDQYENNVSIVPTDEKSSTIISPTIEVTPSPTIVERYKDFRYSISEDKSLVERGGFVILMGKVWIPLTQNPDLGLLVEEIKNVNLTILKNGSLIKSEKIPLGLSGEYRHASKYFTKKIDTSELEPGQYTVTTLVDSGHSGIVQFIVSESDENSRKCGSTICSIDEKCCNDICYDPLTTICVNGTNRWPSGVRCGTFWCSNGQICCGGQCIYEGSGGYIYYCGFQWDVQNLRAAAYY